MNKKDIRKRLELLEEACDCSKKEQSKHLKELSDNHIDAMCEGCMNLLKENIPLSSRKKSQLKRKLDPIKLELRKLSDPKVSTKTKRKILTDPQTGSGVFTILASTVIPALISALASK